MYDNSAFEQLVANGNSTGEVIGVERFLLKVKGLDGAPVGALVMFQTGQRGLVREVRDAFVLVLNANDRASQPPHESPAMTVRSGSCLSNHWYAWATWFIDVAV